MNFLTIDVEDWFHILDIDGTPDINQWNLQESRVEKNFFTLLELLDKHNVKATCFFLGWIARTQPKLVLEAFKRGHEISSHGFSHQLIYTQTKEQFQDDISFTRKLLEDIIGYPVFGYRSPGFSITNSVPWAFSEIIKAGYTYDSSLFPATRGHGGYPGALNYPHRIVTDSGDLAEFPISVTSLLGKQICFSGGGYLRFFPYSFIRHAANRLNNAKKPVVFYVHPRDIDISQPRLRMGFGRFFKSYFNMSSTIPKLEKIMRDNQFRLMNRWLDSNYMNLPRIREEELPSPGKKQNHQYQ